MGHSEDSDAAGFRKHDDLRISVGSEDVAATRYEPTGTEGPSPTLFHYTPYRKDDWAYLGYHRYVSSLACRGYEVLIADVVGTGASTGTKTKPYSEAEGEQAEAIIEWIANQPWSDGRVGMFGFSYSGMTALRTAIREPDSLEAIATLHAGLTTYPRRGVKSSSLITGGSIGHKAAVWFSMIGALQALPPSRRRSDGGRWADIWKTRLDDLRERSPWLFDFIRHESPKDEYWDTIDMPLEDVKSTSIPHLAIRGFRDSYVHPATKFFQDSPGETRLVLGPWRHTIPNQGIESSVDFHAQLGDWFDHYIKGEDNNVATHDPVEYWTEWSGEEGIDGVWRTRKRWPSTEESTECVSFAVSSNGLCSPDSLVAAEEFQYEVDQTVGINSVMRTGPSVDPSDDDARSLSFETRPLENPVELTGTGSATVRFQATTSDPILALRLVDVSPSGSATLVTNGHLRVAHRDGHSEPKPITAGEEYEVTLPLNPKSYVFQRNHKIRLSISGAYFPLMLPSGKQGAITIQSRPDNPTTVTFPGKSHNGPVEFTDTIDMPVPDPETMKPFARTDASVETSREHTSDTATFAARNSRSGRLPFADLDGTITQRSSVQQRDPSSAVLVGETTISLEYPTDRFEADVAARISRDTTQMSTTVHRGDQVVFDETWSV